VGKIVVRVPRKPQPGPRMPRFLKPLILLVAVTALAGLARVDKAQARLESKCSQNLIHDWYVDGRIDQTYPVHCYREALRGIPEDQFVYGTLRDDLTRALQSVIRNGDGPVGPNTPVPGNSSGPDDPSGSASGNKDKGFFNWVARKLGPSTAESIPIPLLVLGGLALALMAAAAISFFARRWQARRADPPPTTPY
jgi:hypothetical protein